MLDFESGKKLGYVRLYRKILKSSVFQNDGLLKIVIWALLKASWEDEYVSMKTGRGETIVHVPPGSFVTGRKKAAKELKMTPSGFWKRLQQLSSEKFRFCDIKSDRHYSLISIVNWADYQGAAGNGDRQSDNQVTTKEQPSDTYKKEKKEKKEKKRDIVSSSDEVEKWNRVISLWNEIAIPNGLDKIKILTTQRKKKYQARVKSFPDFWQILERELPRFGPFAKGENDRGWAVDFTWIIKSDDNFAKIAEGIFRNKDKRDSVPLMTGGHQQEGIS